MGYRTKEKRNIKEVGIKMISLHEVWVFGIACGILLVFLIFFYISTITLLFEINKYRNYIIHKKLMQDYEDYLIREKEAKRYERLKRRY